MATHHVKTIKSVSLTKLEGKVNEFLANTDGKVIKSIQYQVAEPDGKIEYSALVYYQQVHVPAGG